MFFKKNNPFFYYEPNENLEPEESFSLASTNIPKWYKDIPKFLNNEKPTESLSVHTLKLCVPFLESLTTGYQILLPADIIVSSDENHNPVLQWRSSATLVRTRDSEQKKYNPVPIGCNETNFIWHFLVSLKVKKGYSFLVNHPFNRYDLPFITLSGVVDGGYAMGNGNLPFFMKQGFEGIIAKGTPIAQILPFKNEKWNLQKQDGLYHESMINNEKTRSVLSGWYKNTHWQKKKW